MKYALSAVPQRLPPPAQTRASLYSVPRPDGGYEYYEGPPGSLVAQNDDLPPPVFPHANDVGVSSLAIGRPLPPGARHVGRGDDAIGSVTAMPGVRADGPLATGLGALLPVTVGADGLGFADTTPSDIQTASRASLFAIGLSALLAGAIVWKASRG